MIIGTKAIKNPNVDKDGYYKPIKFKSIEIKGDNSMRTLDIDLPESLCDELQRLQFKEDATLSVIGFMFDSHKNDADSSVVDSLPFKRYMEDYTKLHTEYNAKKEAVSAYIVSQLEGVNPDNINWRIYDFKLHTAHVTINE